MTDGDDYWTTACWGQSLVAQPRRAAACVCASGRRPVFALAVLLRYFGCGHQLG